MRHFTLILLLAIIAPSVGAAQGPPMQMSLHAIAELGESTDTTLLRIQLRGGPTVIGRMQSLDSNHFRVDLKSGGYSVFAYSDIKSISQAYWPPYRRDTSKYLNSIPRNIPSPISSYHAQNYSPQKFAGYVVPSVFAGAAMTAKNADGKTGIAWAVAAMFAARIPGVLYDQMRFFLMTSLESRAFSVAQTDADDLSLGINYLGITPGISMRGLISLGLTIGYPFSGAITSYINGAGQPYNLSPQKLHLLLEPRIILGFPLWYDYNDGTAMFVHIMAGYPLTPTFKDVGVSGIQTSPAQSAGFFPNEIRTPEIMLGFSYVLPLSPWARRGGIMMID